MSLLRTHNLEKHFEGVTAVNKLSVAFEPGRITGVIGPNGSGKTTFINLLTGLVPLDKGTVQVSGVTLEKVHSHEVAAYGITRTFQNVRLFEQMKVQDNVLVALTERNVWSALFERYKDLHAQQAEEVLRRVGLWEKRNELAANLSYGQRKLLEIARVLAMDADIILFDEPFAGLFPEMVEKVADILEELKKKGKTVVLVEHNMELIRKLSDHVIVIDAGALLAEGDPDEVLARKDVIEAYLGE